VCASGEDTKSPVLPEASQTCLRNALQVFSNALTSGSSIQTATVQGLAAFKAEEHAAREVTEFSHRKFDSILSDLHCLHISTVFRRTGQSTC